MNWIFRFFLEPIDIFVEKREREIGLEEGPTTSASDTQWEDGEGVKMGLGDGRRESVGDKLQLLK